MGRIAEHQANDHANAATRHDTSIAPKRRQRTTMTKDNDASSGSPALERFLSFRSFRKKVFGDLEAINAVEHATLLRGCGLPRVDKYVLKRFLIARKFDVEKAYGMLMTYIDW